MIPNAQINYICSVMITWKIISGAVVHTVAVWLARSCEQFLTVINYIYRVGQNKPDFFRGDNFATVSKIYPVKLTC